MSAAALKSGELSSSQIALTEGVLQRVLGGVTREQVHDLRVVGRVLWCERSQGVHV